MPNTPKARLSLALLVAFGLAGPGRATAPQAAAPDPRLVSLNRLFVLQDQLRDIHPAFDALYPVAVVERNRFYIYVPDADARTYRLDSGAPDDYHLPVGVRAAMPLSFWGNRIACVVTPEVFAEPGGYAIIFHEFVHCYQWETCELALKKSLGIFRTAMDKKDFMWELQYPFPYGDPEFVRAYGDMLGALRAGDDERVVAVRDALKDSLASANWEYMTWQEWKEGTARFLENRIKARLGIPANAGGLEPPFTRVTFYAGGELLIRMLDRLDPGLARDIEALYRRIAD